MDIKELNLLGIKAEGTYGTDPVPTVGSNLIPALNDSLTYKLNSTHVSRKLADGTHSKVKGLTTFPFATVKFRYELRGNGAIQSGDSADAVEIDALLKACDLVPTYTAETGAGDDGYVTYNPRRYLHSVGDSVTIYWWSNGRLHKITGAKGNIDRITVMPEQIIVADFTFTGFYTTPSATTFPASGHAWLDQVPPMATGITMIAAAGTDYTPAPSVYQMAEFSLGNAVVRRDSVGSTNGIKGFVVATRNSTGRFECDAELESSFAAFGWITNDNPNWRGLKCVADGGSLGNRVEIMFGGQPTNHDYGDRNGIRTNVFDMEVGLNALTRSGYADEFYIKFY